MDKMNCNTPNRQITVGFRCELQMPDDMSLAVQLLANRSHVKIVETYRTLRIPSERDVCLGLFNDYGKVSYQGDTVAYVPDKPLEDDLIRLLIDLRNQFLTKKDIVSADKITEQLRSMGVVLTNRAGSEIFWNESGKLESKKVEG